MTPIKVLVAPLDWGLGHASRMVRIIMELRTLGCDVVVAGSGNSLNLLKREFPDLPYELLAAYDPLYAASGRLIPALILQGRKFLRVIRLEHEQTKSIVERHGIQLIFSDNRYGCRSPFTHNIFITHQLNLLLPRGWKWMEKWINRLHRSFIKKFDECWVPDWQGANSLVPALSQIRSEKVRYIGPLSRFGEQDEFNPSSSRFSLLIVLSGPEPQRTMIERIVMNQIHGIGSVCLVRGIPDENLKGAPDNVVVKGLASTSALRDIIRHSDVVIARSGYSTLMDFATLGGKVIFIPTPGQTEQEYIGRVFEEKRIAHCVKQNNFNLQKALEEATSFTGFSRSTGNDRLPAVIRQKIGDLMTNQRDNP